MQLSDNKTIRINRYVALATGLSRRAADIAVHVGRIKVNGIIAETGQTISDTDTVTLDNQLIHLPEHLTLILNKPTGYICSRNGQGGRIIYDLLPAAYQHLKPVGRLDKDSSGLLILTNDGKLAHQLTHPSFQKRKVYEIEIDKPLQEQDFIAITTAGVDIGDEKPSTFQLASNNTGEHPYHWQTTLTEGRNRQIRRTFAALGYIVTKLHRTHFGTYTLNNLKLGTFRLEP